MSTRNKNEKKKSKFNFWSEKAEEPHHASQVNGVGISNITCENSLSELHDSRFQKSLKKLRTSSLRAKKKTSEDVSHSSVRSFPNSLIIHDSVQNNAKHTHSPVSSPHKNSNVLSLETLTVAGNGYPYMCQTTEFSSFKRNDLSLSGIGLLGDFPLVYSKMLSKSSELLPDEISSIRAPCTSKLYHSKSEHKSFRTEQKFQKTNCVQTRDNFMSIDSIQIYSNGDCKTNDFHSVTKPKGTIDDKINEKAFVSKPSCGDNLEVNCAIAANQNISPESLSEEVVWKPRLDEIWGTYEGPDHSNKEEESESILAQGVESKESSNNDDEFSQQCSNAHSDYLKTKMDNVDSEAHHSSSTVEGFEVLPQYKECISPYPKGWEARVDPHGRVFYINHIEKTTSWMVPSVLDSSPCCPKCHSQECSRNEDILLASNHEVENTASVLIKPTSPGLSFLLRPDFYTVLRKNKEGLLVYNQSPHLKHMINKIRKDHNNFDRHQHNRDLVNFLNLFSDSMKRLPAGWEMRFDTSSRPFFIDHHTRNTTFIDPRLPQVSDQHKQREGILSQSVSVESNSRRENGGRHQTRSLSAPRTIHRSLSPEQHLQDLQTYGEKVVSFLSRPNIMDHLCSRHHHLASNIPLKNKIIIIAKQGVDALHRFSDDLDLTMFLSQFESEIISYKPESNNYFPQVQKSKSFIKASLMHSLSDQSKGLSSSKHDFPSKLGDFYRKLDDKGYACGPWKIRLEIMRERILEDSFKKIMSLAKKDMRRSKLLISFVGEDGLDYGGPSKEFFFLISRELFNPYYGLFEYSSTSSYTLQISPMSLFLENYQEWFRFAGRIIGLAILHQHLLDVFFVRTFYKALLKENVTLSDIEALDYEYYKSLLWIKDGDNVNFQELGLTFSVDEEVAGKITEVELKPNGAKLGVTHKNRKDYIDRVVKWRVTRGIKEQTDHLIRGFHEVLDHRLMTKFDAHELEFVISGTAEIDVEDWKRNTTYRAGYHDRHVVVEWFWSVVDSYSNERRLRLLQFVTGTSSIPHEGFAALRGNNGPKKFSIEKWGEVTSLPRAHTCFNRLDLPPYTSYHMMHQKITIAIEETSTFGIE